MTESVSTSTEVVSTGYLGEPAVSAPPLVGRIVASPPTAGTIENADW